MSPEILFWLSLATKMAVAAGFVISATVVAERAGPFIGALFLTLPISAGPAYLFLSLDHDAGFISEGALASLSNNIGIMLYALAFIFLAQRLPGWLSVGIGLVIWLGLTILVQMTDWTPLMAVIANIVTFLVCFVASRRFCDAPMPRIELRFADIVMRAALVATLVATVVTLSFHIGAAASGILASAPVVYTSIMLILHRRVGGPATAAVIAHGFPGLLGFSAALLTLHFTAVPLGKAAGLALALAVAMIWNSVLFAARRWAAA